MHLFSVNHPLRLPSLKRLSDIGATMRYDHQSLPAIDYASHPAYAPYVAAAGFQTRLLALKLFTRGIATAAFHWAVDVDYLPRPPAGEHKLLWMARRAQTLFAIGVQNTLLRIRRTKVAPDGVNAAAIAASLRSDGVVALSVRPEDHAALLHLTAPWFAALRERMDLHGTPAFDDNRLRIDEAAAPELYAHVRASLGRIGVLSGASAYLGRPITVAHLIPQINNSETDFWTGAFADIGEPDSACNYCHVDTAWGVTKMLIYMSDVTSVSGPFAYVRGSHETAYGFWDRLVRKGNDHAGLSSSDPKWRRLFAALPKPFRRKGAFGQDLIDTHPRSADIIAAEHAILSSDANAVLFDPNGIHRGGMVRQSERLVLGVLFGGPTLPSV